MIQHITNNFSDHVISYETRDTVINLCNVYIDYNDIKTFASMLVDFCSALNSEIKIITQLASKKDYNENKNLYSDFTVRVINDDVIELSIEPSLFPSAMFNVLGFKH